MGQACSQATGQLLLTFNDVRDEVQQCLGLIVPRKLTEGTLDIEHPVAPFLVGEADLRGNGCSEKQWHF